MPPALESRLRPPDPVSEQAAFPCIQRWCWQESGQHPTVLVADTDRGIDVRHRLRTPSVVADAGRGRSILLRLRLGLYNWPNRIASSNAGRSCWFAPLGDDDELRWHDGRSLPENPPQIKAGGDNTGESHRLFEAAAQSIFAGCRSRISECATLEGCGPRDEARCRGAATASAAISI